jgi:transposase, IS30 family
MGRPGVSIRVRREFWLKVLAGCRIDDAAASVGVSRITGYRWVQHARGVTPSFVFGARAVPGSRLTIAEREEIAVELRAGVSIRAIAKKLGRDPATISREVTRNRTPSGYRGWSAQHKAQARAREKNQVPRKLAPGLALTQEVHRRLRLKHSPEQIAARLKADFPDQPEMQVSHETIYRSIFLQARGELRKELTQALRTGRAARKPRPAVGQRPQRIRNMVMISERPAEIEDRAVPGHWEGDLIQGSTQSASAIATLVERTTGCAMLLRLDGDHTSLTVATAITTAMRRLPQQLRKSLTWDQGIEMSRHADIRLATNVDVYFCDPHSPWQRGSNENFNGLARQYLPKGTDLSRHSQEELDEIAAEINARPRKRHGWATPAEMLEKLLSETKDHERVALTP